MCCLLIEYIHKPPHGTSNTEEVLEPCKLHPYSKPDFVQMDHQ